jgi:putative membrane protein
MTTAVGLAQTNKPTEAQTTPPPVQSQTSDAPKTGVTSTENDKSDTTTRRNKGATTSGTQQTTSGTQTTAAGTDSSRNRAGEFTDMVNPVDKQFMMKAAASGLMEVQMAQLAQKNGTSDAVKNLAQKIEQDHSSANKELTDIASRKSISLPTEVDPKQKNEIDKLSKLSGAAFDKAYVKKMVSEHKKDISEFEKQGERGMDSDIKGFSTKTLPALREHLRMAQEANDNKVWSAPAGDKTPAADKSKS